MSWTLLVFVVTVGPLMDAHPTTWADGGDTEQQQDSFYTLQFADSILPGTKTFPPNDLSFPTAQGKAFIIGDQGKSKDIYLVHRSGDQFPPHVSAATKKSLKEWRHEGQGPRIAGVDLQLKETWAGRIGEDEKSVGQETERTSDKRKYAIQADDSYTKEESNYVDRGEAFAGYKNTFDSALLSSKGLPSSDRRPDRRGYQRLLNAEDTPEHAQYHHDNGDHGHHYDVEHGHDAEGHYLAYDRHGSGHDEHDKHGERAKYHHNPGKEYNRRHDDGDDRHSNGSQDREHHHRGGYKSRSRERHDRGGYDSRSRKHHDRGYNSRSREHHDNGYGHNHGQEYGHDDQDSHGHDDHHGYGHDDHRGYGHDDHHGYGHDDHRGYGHDDQHEQEYGHGDHSHGQDSHHGDGYGSHYKRGHHNSQRNGDRPYYGHPYNLNNYYGHPQNHGQYSTLGSIWNEIRNYFRFP